MDDSHDRATGDRIERVDASIAKQLQRSVEKNGRMVRRLRDLRPAIEATSFDSTIVEAIDAILNDQDPVWPGE